jgi:hypothetical protein
MTKFPAVFFIFGLKTCAGSEFTKEPGSGNTLNIFLDIKAVQFSGLLKVRYPGFSAVLVIY